MSFWKKHKIKKIRAEIVEDSQLLPEQKEYALARLDEKEQTIFQPVTIANQTQAIFENLLPTIVGQVQLKRLKTRNEMIREMRVTLNELAETKKAWARLSNIDAEIAVDQALAYQAQQEKEAAHRKTMAKFRFEKNEIEQRAEQDDLRHSVDKLKLEMELEALQKKRAEGDPKEKTLAEKLREIAEQLKLDKAEIIGALELKQLERDFEQATENNGNEATKLDIYERLRDRVKSLRKRGVGDDTIRKIYELIDREFDFDRDADD